jgi:hypothetical protein
MTDPAEKLLHQAMKLSAPERAALVEGLVESNLQRSHLGTEFREEA